MNITPAAQRLLDAAYEREDARGACFGDRGTEEGWMAVRAAYTRADARLDRASLDYYNERKAGNDHHAS